MGDILSTYGWWILGLVLLGLEVAAPGVYLLFFGIAALVIGTNVVFFPELSWQAQVIGFVVVSAVAVLLGHKWYGQRGERTDGPELNRRTQRLIGRTATLSEAIVGGRGRVSLDDGWWSVEGPDYPAGTQVVVESADGSVLKVRLLDAGAKPVP